MQRTVYSKPRQSLGQNFLIDENIARNIIRDFHLHPDDVVVEIGPGRGALTSQLAGRVRHLILVEIDGRIVEELGKQFSSPQITIVNQDFLDVDLKKWQERYHKKLRLIGNIPYHLTSPILFKAFEERAAIRDVMIMVQREVARRIVARPGTKDYGILSVAARFYGEPSVLFNVSPNCFYPKPKVTSALDLARFLAQRGRFGEARALCDEYDELADKMGWKVFRPEIAEIRRLIAAGQPAN